MVYRAKKLGTTGIYSEGRSMEGQGLGETTVINQEFCVLLPTKFVSYVSVF